MGFRGFRRKERPAGPSHGRPKTREACTILTRAIDDSLNLQSAFNPAVRFLEPNGHDIGTHGTTWSLSAIGDFNADGTTDVMWRDPVTAEVDQWQLSAGRWAQSIDLGAMKGRNWSLSGIGDFNGDGADDVLWRDISNGQVDQWQMKDGNWNSSIDLGQTKGADWESRWRRGFQW